MKLEIDIPSILYNDAKENRGYISVGKMEIAWKAIADGKPLEQEPKTDVLDKIKTEILLREKNVKDVRTDGHCFFTANEICEIIDKHMAEGE